MPDVQPNLSLSESASGSDSNAADPGTPRADIPKAMADLLDRLKSESIRNQLQIVQELAASEAGIETLMRFLSDRASANAVASPIEGRAVQVLQATNLPKAQDFLRSQFPPRSGGVAIRAGHRLQRAASTAGSARLRGSRSFDVREDVRTDRRFGVSAQVALLYGSRSVAGARSTDDRSALAGLL